MRILSHRRGNPDTEASRSLNHRVTSRLHSPAAVGPRNFRVVACFVVLLSSSSGCCAVRSRLSVSARIREIRGHLPFLIALVVNFGALGSLCLCGSTPFLQLRKRFDDWMWH